MYKQGIEIIEAKVLKSWNSLNYYVVFYQLIVMICRFLSYEYSGSNSKNFADV